MSPAPKDGLLPAGLWATHAHLPPPGPPSQAAVQKPFSRFDKGYFSRREKIGFCAFSAAKKKKHEPLIPPPTPGKAQGRVGLSEQLPLSPPETLPPKPRASPAKMKHSADTQVCSR